MVIRHDHAIDQQLYQLPFLFEGGRFQSQLDSLAEIFDVRDQAREFFPAFSLNAQLIRLSLQSRLPLFEILASALILSERNHITEIRLGEAR